MKRMSRWYVRRDNATEPHPRLSQELVVGEGQPAGLRHPRLVEQARDERRAPLARQVGVRHRDASHVQALRAGRLALEQFRPSDNCSKPR
jgi:hypothetical protein